MHVGRRRQVGDHQIIVCVLFICQGQRCGFSTGFFCVRLIRQIVCAGHVRRCSGVKRIIAVIGIGRVNIIGLGHICCCVRCGQLNGCKCIITVCIKVGINGRFNDRCCVQRVGKAYTIKCSKISSFIHLFGGGK